MMLEITAIIDEIIRKRKANANVPHQILESLKSLRSKIEQFKSLQQATNNLSNNTFDAVQKMNQFDFRIVGDRIAQEQEKWELLCQRLNRNTINIGVIGLARQGKSTLLQKVSGLTDDEIPTSDLGSCTSVQSNIYHFDENTNTYANVYFYSESSFLEQVIKPYYEELGFSNVPKSLTQFRESPFPVQQKNPRHPAKAEAIYKRLKDDYHAHFGDYAHLLKRPKRCETITKDEIKQYVSQDYDEKHNRKFFKHLAVKKVEIFCPFPEIQVKKIGLVDMPGLGDTRLGDTERMIKALVQDVDFILFVRRPNKGGDQWGKNTDIPLYDDASQALQDKLPLQEWSFMLLNHDGENDRQCHHLEKTRTKEGIHVKKCLTANCEDTEQANQILREALHDLVENIAPLDQKYMSAAFKELKDFQNFVEQEIDKIQYVIEGLGDIDREYIKLREGFLKQLYKEIENFRAKVRQEFTQPNEEFKKQIDIVIKRCEKEVSIPSQEYIEILAKRRGIDKAYFDAVQEIRSDFLKQFHSIEGNMRQSFDKTKSNLAEIFIRSGLGRLNSQQGTAFLEALARLLSKTNDLQSLAMGFKFILSFEMTYNGMIQSYVWKTLSEVLPPDPMKPIKTPDSMDVTVNSLRQFHATAIEKCQEDLNRLGKSINNVQISMVEEFADHVTRARGVEQEWDIFLNHNRCQIWSQLQDLEEQKQLQQQWLTLVDETLSICQNLNV